jgi:hypothetical protein
MSIDEMGRASAGRTTAAIAAAGDTDAGYVGLLAVHRRRSRARVVVAAAALVAVLIVVFAGSGSLSHHRSELVSFCFDTKPYRAAPPFCGPLAQELPDYVHAGGVCPAGPGRYLSLTMGIGTSSPFAFTLPPGWTVEELAGAGGGGSVPYLGGLLLQSTVTGHALVLTEYPTEVPDVSNEEAGRPKGIASRLATRQFVQPTKVSPATLGGRAGWRVDLQARSDAVFDGHCVLGDRCAVTFGLAGDDFPGRPYVGLLPGVPSTALVFNALAGGGIVTLAWTWGDPDRDPELGGLLMSLDFRPPVVCEEGFVTCPSAPPAIGSVRSYLGR